jgi:hypothetical protein
MYVPPYDAILNAIGLTANDVAEGKSVTIPSALFKFLLQTVVANGAFDEDQYLRKNADVKNAIGTGKVASPHWHYTGFGYFENRRGATPTVDDGWYLRTYPDVADAIRTGKVRSAGEHFETTGAQEWRAPRAELLRDVQSWKAATRKG